MDYIPFISHLVLYLDFVTSLRQPLNIILYSNVSFASMQEKVRHSGGIDGYVLVGDFNARFGVTVKDIPCLAEVANNTLYEFPSLPDSIHQSNENAKVLRGICVEDGLMVFNNVKVHEQQHFKGGKA